MKLDTRVSSGSTNFLINFKRPFSQLYGRRNRAKKVVREDNNGTILLFN